MLVLRDYNPAPVFLEKFVSKRVYYTPHDKHNRNHFRTRNCDFGIRLYGTRINGDVENNK